MSNKLDTTEMLTRYKQQAMQQSLQTKINNYIMAGISHEIVRDADGTIVEVLTDADKRHMLSPVPVATETGHEWDTWHGTFIVDAYKYPMPTNCLNNKNYNAKEYAGLMTISNRGSYENHRYLYKNSFDTAELAKDLGISRITLERNIKKLEKLDCNILEIENSRKNGVIYKLNYGTLSETTGNLNKFVTIYHPMLKELACSFNSNAIKIYCLLSYMCNETDFKMLTEDWICQQIGLNGDSERNQSSVRTLIKTLEKCKFIETRKQNVFRWDDVRKREVPQITKFYRLCTLDEWKKLDKKVD